MNNSKLKYYLSSTFVPLFVALTLRIVYWLQVHDQAWFQTPDMDPELYREWALAILGGKGAEWLPFPRGPLYSYFLAGIWALFGDGWLAPRLFNLVCDLITTLAVWRIADQIGGRKTALAGSLTFAMVGASVYYSGELLMTSLETCLTALFVVAFIATIKSRRWYFAASAGLSLGLLSLCRPNALPLFLFAPLLVVWILRRQPQKSSLTVASILAVTAMLAITPATYLNYRVAGKFVPIATQGGVNVLIGNARGATGWASVLPGVGADWTDADAKILAEKDAGKPLASHEASNQLWDMGLREIKADFPAWLQLEAKKLLLLVNFREIGNNRPLNLPIEASLLIRLLFLISLGTLIPFALLGIGCLRGKSEIFGPIALTLFVMGGSLFIFFINTRYRAPLVPVTAALAGVGLVELWRHVRRPIRFSFFVPLVLGAVLCFPPWAGSDFDNPAQGYFVAGNALVKQGRIGEALTYYRRAAQLNSSYPKLNLNMGVAYLNAGDLPAAANCFRNELRVNPRSTDALNNLGAAEERNGDLAQAENFYRNALNVQPTNEDARANLTHLLLSRGDRSAMSGDLPQAEANYRNAAVVGFNDPKPLTRLAALYASRGDHTSALALLDSALTISSGYDPALRLREQLVQQR